MARTEHDTRPGTEVELEIGKVAHGGIFVARHEGRVVFVSDAITGERVRARISDDKHDRFWRAETVEVLEASPDRREHVWSAASIDRAPEDRAGGAEFGHINLKRQRLLKAEVLAEGLQRFAGIEHEVTVEPIATVGETTANAETDGTGWRTRVRLQVDESGVVGPYASRSHTVIPVQDLPLATPALAGGAPLSQRFAGAAHVDVVAPVGGGIHVLVAEVDKRGKPKKVKGSRIIEKVGDREFQLSSAGFWQVHSGAPSALYNAVASAIDGDEFDPKAANMDLYGGVGLLAASVGDRFGSTVRITSVESDAIATDNASENLAEWMGASAITERVDRYLDGLDANANQAERRRIGAATVVLDPPRSGAGAAVVDRLASLAPKQIIYVACDPIALARDLARFATHGYHVAQLRAFDLFPNTHHVEAVVRLTR